MNYGYEDDTLSGEFGGNFYFNILITGVPPFKVDGYPTRLLGSYRQQRRMCVKKGQSWERAILKKKKDE
jgi:hypothetical protein